jgi:hypothetical protein
MTDTVREEGRPSVRASQAWLQSNSLITGIYRSENCFEQMLQREVKQAFTPSTHVPKVFWC